MKFFRLIPFILLFFGILPYKNPIQAEVKKPNDYKIFANDNKKLSISNVEYYLSQGDDFLKKGDFDNAKTSFLDARKLAKQLANFYSDLNTAFIGVDARIPKEMQKKGKAILQILAESNTRLAAFYIRNNKPDVAVPLLIETIRIMSPSSEEGKKAYTTLIQLGFVDTNYKG